MKTLPSIYLILLFFFSCNQSNEKQTKPSEMKKEHTSTTNSTNEENTLPKELLIKLGMDVDEGHPQGLKIGDQAPTFSTQDHMGNALELNQLLKQGPVVLQFYRGDWCPVCNRYLSAFQDSVQLIKDRGAQVIAITPQTNEYIKKTIAITNIEYPVIADKGYSIMKNYKVLFKVTESYDAMIKDKLQADIASSNNDKTPYLPVPATYVIGKDGKIKYVHFNPKYQDRATVNDILAHL